MAGMNLFAAIAMAILHRERTGRGQRGLDFAACRRPVVECPAGARRAARLLRGAAAAAHHATQRPRQPVPHSRRPLDPAHHRARGQALGHELCAAMERLDLLGDPRFQTTEDIRRAQASRVGRDPRSDFCRPSVAGVENASAASRDHLRPAGRAARRAGRRAGRSPTAPIVRERGSRRCRAPISAPIRLSFAPVSRHRPGRDPATASTPTRSWPNWATARTRSAGCVQPVRWDESSAVKKRKLNGSRSSCRKTRAHED